MSTLFSTLATFNRFSVNLDFDLLDSLKVKSVFKELKLILTRRGSIKPADRASYERIVKTNQDLYDYYFFLSRHYEINIALVESRTGLSFEKFLEDWLSAIEKMTSRSILAGMGELLDEKQKSWVRNHLKAELIFQIKLLLMAQKDHQQ